MKRNLLTLMSLFFIISLFAQSPDFFNYQAVARDANGDIRADENVSFTFTIIQNTADGNVIYLETQDAMTNSLGLVNLKIGEGTTIDDLATIDWSMGPYFLEVDLDGTVMGTTQLLSVPYAKYADQAGSVSDDVLADYVKSETLDNYATLDTIASYATKDTLGSYVASATTENWDKDVSDDFAENFDFSWWGDTLYLGDKAVIVPGISASNAASIDGWANKNIASKVGLSTAVLTLVPLKDGIHAATGISGIVAGSYDDLSIIIRFNTDGFMDARNGDSYSSENPISYTGGTKYAVRLVINIDSSRFDAYVTPEGGTEVLLADNYQFRTAQIGVGELNNLAMWSDAEGSFCIDGFEWTVPELTNGVYLSDLDFVESNVAEWNFRLDADRARNDLTIGGHYFIKGVTMCAEANVKYKLDGAYSRFIAWLGIDDDKSLDENDVQYYLIDVASKDTLFKSPVLNGLSEAYYMDVDVSGVDTLEIFIDDMGSASSDWSALGGAILLNIGETEPLVLNADIYLPGQLMEFEAKNLFALQEKSSMLKPDDGIFSGIWLSPQP